MKEKKRDGETGGKPRGSRKNIVGRYDTNPLLCCDLLTFSHPLTMSEQQQRSVCVQ